MNNTTKGPEGFDNEELRYYQRYTLVCEWMPQLDISSKENYLAWVDQWKLRWHWIVAEIRAIRKEYGAGRTWLSDIAHEWHMLRREGKEKSWEAKLKQLQEVA